MDTGAIFILLALMILVAMYLAQPYLEKQAKGISSKELKLSALYAERDQAISALKELEFDNSLGKVPEDDFEPQRIALMKKGAEAMRKIDEFNAGGTDADNMLEAAIQARRGASTLDADDELESMIAARRGKRKAKSGGFCPNCGNPVLQSDKFCTGCGKKV